MRLPAWLRKNPDLKSCAACYSTVGEANPVRGNVGSIVTGCRTCLGERRS